MRAPSARLTAGCDLAFGLCRAGDPLNGFDPDAGRDDHVAVIGFAEIFLHILGIEAPGDLLRGCELPTGDFNKAPALKFVLEQFALGFRAFQDGVGSASARAGAARL